MKTVLNEKRKKWLPGNKDDMRTSSSLTRWILSAFLAQCSWDDTVYITVFRQSQLLMFNINFRFHEWKKGYIYLWPLHWEKKKCRSSDSFILLKTLHSTIWKEHKIRYILDNPVHGAMALPVQSTQPFEFQCAFQESSSIHGLWKHRYAF